MSHPVAPGRFPALALAVAWALGAATLAGWVVQAAVPPAGQAFAAALALACGAVALHAWRHAPRGTLAWDGSAWLWTPEGGAPQQGRAECALDLQSRVLVRWHPTQGRTLWLWARQGPAPLHWDALRRALQARAASDSRAKARPPLAGP